MPLELQTGKELENRYVIHSHLGIGGYGSVWKALDKQLSRDVALKLLLKKGLHPPLDDTNHLLAEARKHAKLVHTNIVQVYDVIQCEGEHLIVMEFVDGPSLHKTLRQFASQSKTLPLDQAVSIISDILEGVAFAHGKHVVHRDLSPFNILMTTTGIPKIGDFGIARVLDKSSSGQTSTQGGTGNPNYMAPEQRRGEQADELSDLFMVGIVGYLLLSGRHPFAHPSGLFEIPDLIEDANYLPEIPKPNPSLTTSEQRLFREYAAIVMRLLNRERAGRFANAQDAIDAIASVTPFQECPQCGERNPERSNFCGDCGYDLRIATEASRPRPVAPSKEAEADRLVNAGYTRTLLRRWSDAIALYNDAIALVPKHEKAHRNLGFSLNQIGKYEEAQNKLTFALTFENVLPAHEASIRYERAFANMQLKQYEDALKDIDKALELKGNSIKARYLRARVNLSKGDVESARADALEVLRMERDHVGALRLLEQI